MHTKFLYGRLSHLGTVLVADIGISSVGPSGSATTVLVSKMDLSEIGCEDGRWMELDQDRVQW
jgi:hypothetical protein